MINVALIGVGYWGSKLKRYIEENPDFHLKYVCDSKSDLNEVWNDPQVSAVVVATRNDTHYQMVKSALLHGKDILVEKPLALKTSECTELKQLAQEHNRLLLVDYTQTFSKGLQKARDLIQAGEIGKLLGIEIELRRLGRFGGGGVYWLLGSHTLSALDMFTSINDLLFRKTDLVTYAGEVETGVISFEGQVSGQIVVSLNYPGKETKIVFYGEKGTIIYCYSPSLRIEKYERLDWTLGSELPRESTEFHFDEFNNLRYVVESFAQGSYSNVDRAIAITNVLEGLE